MAYMFQSYPENLLLFKEEAYFLTVKGTVVQILKITAWEGSYSTLNTFHS